jgi:hypothetical protein
LPLAGRGVCCVILLLLIVSAFAISKPQKFAFAAYLPDRQGFCGEIRFSHSFNNRKSPGPDW